VESGWRAGRGLAAETRGDSVGAARGAVRGRPQRVGENGRLRFGAFGVLGEECGRQLDEVVVRDLEIDSARASTRGEGAQVGTKHVEAIHFAQIRKTNLSWRVWSAYGMALA
jgi:hypothetical protein